ncbi:MAG: glycosyltransferase family 2 protein [Bacilli bacterium]
MKTPILYLVVPCYNEEEVLLETTNQLRLKMNTLIKNKKISKESHVVFINDGSKDNTWEMIEEIHANDSLFSGIKLSRNCGHQNAVMAGLMTCRDKADAIISLDADLQDDINAIDSMVEKYKEGNEIVYGVRSSRKKDTFFKRTTAQGFYKFAKKMDVEMVYNHADYRLLSKKALEALSEFKEVNLFLRGMVPMLGFKQDVVYYERQERFAGTSKYPLKKMLALAMNGITGSSIKPALIITKLGFLTLIISFILILIFLVKFFMGLTVAGWPTIVISIWLLGGLNLTAIGILGQYVGKTYMETKHRPLYIIEKIVHKKGD